MNIVFVCTGNTCRSPMGEGLMKKILAENNIHSVECSSAGIAAFNGDLASENSILACREVNVDISNHAAKNINDLNINKVDLFVAVTRAHADFLYRMGIQKEKIYILGNVQDPFSKSIDEYRVCRDQIQSEVNKLWETIKENL